MPRRTKSPRSGQLPPDPVDRSGRFAPTPAGTGTDVSAAAPAEPAPPRPLSDDEMRRVFTERNVAVLRAIIDAIGALVIATRSDGSVLTWNRRCDDSSGVPFAAVAGRPIWDVFGLEPASSADVRSAIERVVAGQDRVAAFGSEWTRKDGRRARINWTAEFVPAAEASGFVVVTGAEATRANRTARAFAETEGRYEALLDLMPQAVVVGQDGKCVFANRAAATLYGAADRAELIGTSFFDLVAAGEREELRTRLAGMVRDGRSIQIPRGRHLRLDGSEFEIELAAAVVSFNDRPAVEMIIRDLTAHIELEERVRQTSKMEALGRLAGGVAHDFNNLLTVVNGYADILVASLGGDERAQDAAEIRKAGARGTELTAQLLAFGRRTPRAVERIDLNERIGTLVPMLRRLVGEDVQLQVALDRRLGWVEADPGELDQVVMNLVLNGRDAMPGGGDLRLTTSLLPAAAQGIPEPSALPWARIEIGDSGYGIAPEYLERIFEPFFTTKEKGKGTGLGLAIVFGVVEQMGGHIHVHSTVGVGSRFQVDLPLTTPVPLSVSAPPPPASIRGSETILLVEDEPAVRAFCKRALEAEGYRVVATGPEGAVDEAARLGEELDLLLSDVVMPELDGPTIAAALTARRPNLPVLFMSGYPRDLESAISGAVADGAMLAKPFDSVQLNQAVRRTLERRRPDVTG